MSSWARATAGCVGLGLAATVAVAWTGAVMANPARFDPQLTARLRRSDFARADADEAVRWLDSAYRARGLQVLIYEKSTVPEKRSYTIRAGWPLPALHGSKLAASDTDGAHHAWAIGMRDLVDLRFEFQSKVMIKASVPRLLPLAPYWPGLLADTALLAVPSALLVLGALGARRHWRRRHGRCPACGYDLRGGTGSCAECGRAASSRIRS